MAINKHTSEVQRVQKLPGPVLYSCWVGDKIVFATMAEKNSHKVTVWAGNEKAFHQVAYFKTKKSNWLWREIAGYSTVVLPEGTGSPPYLFCTPIGTSDYSDTLVKINLS